MRIRFVLVLIGTMLSAGCVTHIKPAVETNPPPTERFGNFDRFELAELELAAEYANSDSGQKAARKIQANLSTGMQPKLAAWTGKGRTAGRVLRIEPRVEKIKFVSIGDRLMVGAMAGSSAVIMKVRYRDAATGSIVAEPEFYQSANVNKGGFGIADNLMLDYIADMVVQYTSRNYDSAVGGQVRQ